ncbi:MAG: Hpt domain-containing protein [Bacteroidota bacterium]
MDIETKTEVVKKKGKEFDTHPKVNLTCILEECMGQVVLLEELVRLFKQNILEFLGNIRVRLQAQDYQGIAFACHKIKSCLRMMQIHSLLEIAEQMERVCKTDKDLKHLEFLYTQFLEEYPGIDEQVDSELLALKNNQS